MPFAISLLALVAVVVTISRRVYRDDRRSIASSVISSVPHALVLAALSIMAFLGLLDEVPLSVSLPVAAAMCSMGALSAFRPSVAAYFEHTGQGLRTVGSLGLLVLASVAAWLAIETGTNTRMLDGTMHFWCVVIGFMTIWVMMAFGYLLTNRRSPIATLVAIACTLLGVAEYFVVTFKGMPILPSDLLALGTAAEVSGEYTYALTYLPVIGIACGMLSVTVCQMAGAMTERIERDWRNAVATGSFAALMMCLYVSHLVGISYYDDLTIQVRAWKPLPNYCSQGFIPSFISCAQKMIPEKPDGYDPDGADALIERLAGEYDEDAGKAAQSASQSLTGADSDDGGESVEPPTIVAVMNETFSDLSIYDGLDSGYEGPEFFKSLSRNGAVRSGILNTSAFGGGTCNTEFEFLTGCSMGYLSAGIYPYTLYDMSHVESLTGQLSDEGYETIAMHPNLATNWNRENVYSQFGFDEFLDISDFEGADTLRNHVSDAATYDRVLDVIGSSDERQFVFDVTMQNHSGYTTGMLIGSDEETDCHMPGLDSWALNEYLTCIEYSDRALEDFVGELRELDKPVMLVFFGDHQPSMGGKANDVSFDDPDDMTHTAREYQTVYLIWTNYDTETGKLYRDMTDEEREEFDGRPTTSDSMSVNYLGASVIRESGVGLTDYQKALLEVKDEMPSVSAVGHMSPTGEWSYNGEVDANGNDAYDELGTMQYRMLFDNGGSVFSMTLQGQANDTFGDERTVIDAIAGEFSLDDGGGDGDGDGGDGA